MEINDKLLNKNIIAFYLAIKNYKEVNKLLNGLRTNYTIYFEGRI